ncbi:MAG: hypothetical protein QOI47_1593, partial [Actinomycetota bacterium]|nr:hypothetical protein [Actinomycetota bacterium]
MRRVIAVALALVALVATAASARAQEETPGGTFSSPQHAVAGAPIWVRSVTPCPGTDPNKYQFVRVGISPQSNPDSLNYLDSTDGDLRPDGSWLVTLSAPSDMKAGITKSYSIQVQCIEDEFQYAAPARNPSSTSTTLAPLFSYFRYTLRALYVTGFASSGASASGDASASSTSSSSSSSSTSTTSTTSKATTTTIGASALGGAHPSIPSKLEMITDAKARAAEARRELEASGIDTSGMSDVQLLRTLPASTTAPSPADGGIPWWSFALASMLAVGAVIA